MYLIIVYTVHAIRLILPLCSTILTLFFFFLYIFNLIQYEYATYFDYFVNYFLEEKTNFVIFS